MGGGGSRRWKAGLLLPPRMLYEYENQWRAGTEGTGQAWGRFGTNKIPSHGISWGHQRLGCTPVIPSETGSELDGAESSRVTTVTEGGSGQGKESLTQLQNGYTCVKSKAVSAS